MRIIAGNFKGRKLLAVAGKTTRPTSGKVREAIFDICGPQIRGARVADLFAGTGAFGLEALSRGAHSAVFVESDPRAIEVIRKNIAACRVEDQSTILRRDILRGDLGSLMAHGFVFDLVFMDPPYRQNALAPALQNLANSRVLARGATVIIEHAAADRLPEDMEGFEVSDRRRYGKTLVSFLSYMVASTK